MKNKKMTEDELKAEIIRSNKIDREIKQVKMDRDFAYPDYHDELIKSAKDYKNKEVTKLPDRFS